MEIQQIYQKINDLAQQLSASKSTMTRADLAYELKNLGISADSPEISRYVWDCYQQFGNQAIIDSFVNNSKTNTLVNEFKIPALIEQGNNNGAFNEISDKLGKTESILKNLEGLIDEKTKLKLIEGASTLMNVVSGTQSIQKIQSEASQIFTKYTEMAGMYSQAKNTIRELTNDFSELRQSTTEMYRKYALTLTDIFGDKIKAAMPEMFNFDSIEFLDVDNMVQNQQLSYNSIYGKCGALVGEVSEGFANTLKLSASQLGAQKDKSVGLVIAGINMMSHYVKTRQRTQSLNKELAELKSSISHDVATIRTDEVRLVEIFKTLNDVYIPKAEIFAKSAPQVFDSELQQLVDTIYDTPESKSLRQERDQILAEMRKLERRIADAQMSINYYTGHVSDGQQTLKSLEEQYKEAKNSKPEPPSSIGNVISFGTAKKNYNNEIYEWSKNCEPVVSMYEDLIVDLKVDNDEIESQKAALTIDTQKYNELKTRQIAISKQLTNLVSSSPEIRAKAAKHLDDIIKLLHLAKEIASSKLDERLVSTVKVEKFKDVKLPETIQNAVKSFKDEVVKDIKFSQEDARNLTEGADLSTEQINEIATQGNEALQKGIEICNMMVQLQSMKMNYALSQEHYEAEFQKIKAQFEANVKNIDNQAALLQEIARRVNTASNKDELKQGLLALLGNRGSGFTDQDWQDFLAGNKTINI